MPRPESLRDEVGDPAGVGIWRDDPGFFEGQLADEVRDTAEIADDRRDIDRSGCNRVTFISQQRDDDPAAFAFLAQPAHRVLDNRVRWLADVADAEGSVQNEAEMTIATGDSPELRP